MHHIQKHILKVLTHTMWARFRDMKPLNTDSNAYSYHLKSLCKNGLVEKGGQGYRLTPAGLRYVDYISADTFEPRKQPKIITMLIAQVGDRVLMWQKQKQPFIGSWLFPNGKVHTSDASLHDAAEREVTEKIGIAAEGLHFAGTCSIRASIKGELVSFVLASIYYVSLPPDAELHPLTKWMTRQEIAEAKLAPAISQILDLIDSHPPLFFQEFSIDW